MKYRSPDLASRIQADIDTLDQVYLNFVVPVTVAALGTVIMVTALAFYSGQVAIAACAFLLLAGVALPIYTRKRGAEP
jgi:ATP-binding cassette subfamily C protein CydC